MEKHHLGKVNKKIIQRFHIKSNGVGKEASFLVRTKILDTTNALSLD
jgi:hypothetical protein